MSGVNGILSRRNPIGASSPIFFTANDSASILPYTAAYLRGHNGGFFPESGFDDTEVAELGTQAGGKTFRTFLGEWLLVGGNDYEPEYRVPFYETYINDLGLNELVCVVGEPNFPGKNGGSMAGPEHRLQIEFPDVGEDSKIFANLYEPIWLDPETRNTVNPDNYFAMYMKYIADYYGDFIRFLCVVNEPDFTFSTTQAEQPNSSGTWRLNVPPASQLDNLNAPIYYYIRMLRIAWEVIKRFKPEIFITGGGFGYPYFVKNLCELTDNPGDTDTTTDTNLWGSGTSIKGDGTAGSVTTDFPNKGGAYFDVVCYHTYPFYKLNVWDDGCSCFVGHRHSDWALDKHLEYEDNFQDILDTAGYNGSTYPYKKYIVTETDMLQDSVAGEWGTPESADGYLCKVHVYSQIPRTNGYRTLQLYKYGIAVGADSSPLFNACGLYGDLVTGGPYTPATAPKNQQYWSMLTISELMEDRVYDATRTAALSLPAEIRGVALKHISTNKYVYILWGVTEINESEFADEDYTFAFTINERAELDYSQTNTVDSVSSGVPVNLTGAPSFFIET